MAQATIGAIYNAVKMHRQDTGSEARSVDQLVGAGYLNIDPVVDEQWRFALIGSNEGLTTNWIITHIQAISTDRLPDGAGWMIIFDLETGMFYGYGVEDVSIAEVKLAVASLSVSLQDYKQKFGVEADS